MKILPIFLLGVILLSGCRRQSEAKTVQPADLAPSGVVRPKTTQPPEPTARIQPVAPATPVQVKEVGKNPDPPATGPAVPLDRGSKLVNELLQPVPGAPSPWRSQPLVLRGPNFLVKPAVPTQVFRGPPQRLALKASSKPIRPHAVPEGMPLYGKRSQPRLPEEIHFPVGPLASWPAPNPDAPAPLPILGQYQADLAPLTDPTLEASTAVALEATIPSRTTPAPFLRLNLPDPFEHRQTVRLQTPPPEDSTPRN